MSDAKKMDDSTFLISREEFYRRVWLEHPDVRAMSEWGERVYKAKYENHDPGDEQPR